VLAVERYTQWFGSCVELKTLPEKNFVTNSVSVSKWCGLVWPL